MGGKNKPGLDQELKSGAHMGRAEPGNEKQTQKQSEGNKNREYTEGNQQTISQCDVRKNQQNI